MKRAHYFQHVDFEGLGSIQDWLDDNDYSISSTRFFKNDSLPNPDDIDLLIVMGGPMSVNDTIEYPWIQNEISFIQHCIERNKPVLGICLGAQLIAASLGSKIYPNRFKEIGWFEIFGPESGQEFLPGLFQSNPMVFHWHGETYDLPIDSTLLASSKGCKNQGFVYKTNVIGLQFHLETTPQSAQALVKHCKDELVKGSFIQSRETILSPPKGAFTKINSLMEKVLDYISQT